jgi:hypothetical protein
MLAKPADSHFGPDEADYQRLLQQQRAKLEARLTLGWLQPAYYAPISGL